MGKQLKIYLKGEISHQDPWKKKPHFQDKHPICLHWLREIDPMWLICTEEVQEGEQSEEHSASIPQLNRLQFQQK